MALKNAAIVFSAKYEDIDKIIDQFAKMFDVNIIHVETSYSKLQIDKI